MNVPHHLLRVDGVSKRFGYVTVLRDVSLELEAGEIVGLVGENGAGKSTLTKIIGGVHEQDAGRVLIDDQPVQLKSPFDARAAGMVMVNQEAQVFPTLTVAENLLVDALPRGSRGWIDWKAVDEEARKWLDVVGLGGLDPRRPAAALAPAEHQLIELARALRRSPRVLLLDEPTTALSLNEVRDLYELVRTRRAAGTGVIFISHHITDVLDLCDRIVVLRDGEVVGTHERGAVSADVVIREMIGRPVDHQYRRKPHTAGRALVTVEGCTSTETQVHDVSLVVKASEIVGVTGLLGAGKTSMAEMLFGLARADSGTLTLADSRFDLATWSTRQAISEGFGYVPEDRKLAGLVLGLSIRRNISLTVLDQMSNRFGLLSKKQEARHARREIEALNITPADDTREARFLSGGNQQKVVLAKWFARRPSVLILDEPTKGVDVGAKAEIYRFLDAFVEAGGGVLLMSSELGELQAVADRIYVLNRGECVGMLSQAGATDDRLGMMLAGLDESPVASAP